MNWRDLFRSPREPDVETTIYLFAFVESVDDYTLERVAEAARGFVRATSDAERRAAIGAIHNSVQNLDASAPDILTDVDGEVVFVRGDLGASETAARAYALGQGTNLSGFDAESVEMLPIPEHFVTDAEWWIVRPGTEYAVRYWRFGL